MFKGRLEGLFRRDVPMRRVDTVESDSDDGDGIELLDAHGIGTGRRETREQYDCHGYEY